jgi:predicted nucleic acid-binding protein
MTPSDLCAAHQCIAFDSNAFIYIFDANPEHGPAARAVLWAAEMAGNRLVTSTIAVGETAVGPARIGDEAMADRYAAAIRSIPNLDIVPVTTEIAVDAAVYRGRLGVPLLDALQLATARVAGASVFVTNDRRLPSIPHVELVVLDDLELAVDEAQPSNAQP